MFRNAVVQDISEGQTGFVAEIGVARQLLEEGLPDGFSGVHPQPLRSGVPSHHLAIHVFSGLPVGDTEI